MHAVLRLRFQNTSIYEKVLPLTICLLIRGNNCELLLSVVFVC